MNTELPSISDLFKSRLPSDIRKGGLAFMNRSDRNDVRAVRTDIGNVSLKVHPAIFQRMQNLTTHPDSPFSNQQVMYTPTPGTEECRETFKHIIKASGFESDNLYVQVTDGGSAAMEMVVLGVCGKPGSGEKPLMVIDPAYTNYEAMAQRTGRKVVSVTRTLQDDGKFTLPDLNAIDSAIKESGAGALLVIPYDNPTGHFYDQETMIKLGEICVKNNIWMVSDEAYRELHYTGQPTSSIWGLTNENVPGIEGRRISIETGSKVWNGCGVHIGALVTDRKDFGEKATAEMTANLCANAFSQYVFGALKEESILRLQEWFKEQRDYYKPLMTAFTDGLKNELKGIIVSQPQSSIYSVVDVKNIAKPEFNATDFMMYCASKGVIEMNGEKLTLLVSPMAGFYTMPEGVSNPGLTQMRIAYVAPPEDMKIAPKLFSELFTEYENQR